MPVYPARNHTSPLPLCGRPDASVTGKSLTPGW